MRHSCSRRPNIVTSGKDEHLSLDSSYISNPMRGYYLALCPMNWMYRKSKQAKKINEKQVTVEVCDLVRKGTSPHRASQPVLLPLGSLPCQRSTWLTFQRPIWSHYCPQDSWVQIPQLFRIHTVWSQLHKSILQPHPQHLRCCWLQPLSPPAPSPPPLCLAIFYLYFKFKFSSTKLVRTS